MKNPLQKGEQGAFPELISKLPEIAISIQGVRGWLLQGEKSQAVFFDLKPSAEIPPHSHCAQWGMVIEGKMALTIDGETRVYQKGDQYFIPEGVVHSARFLTRVQAIDVFDNPARYKAKS